MLSRKYVIALFFLLYLMSSMIVVVSFVFPVRGDLRWSALATKTSVRMIQKDAEIAAMKISDIKAELKELNIDYSDCFDKESLVLRLEDARKGKVEPLKKEKVQKSVGQMSTANIPSDAGVDLLGEVRSMSVRELREELASRGIRWADFFEKNDLIQAVMEARRNAASFSATGLILPGKVADLSGENLQREIENKTILTPLFVDVYATWCGPCKLMAGQLKEAASHLGSRIRFAKMDSDKYAPTAGQLRVQGLPTLILFRGGEEIDRIEGALMKEQLVQWIESKL